MTTPKLIKYIEEQQEEGQNEILMENKLMKAGWKAEDIEEAYQEINEKQKKKARLKNEKELQDANLSEETIKVKNSPNKTAGYWIRMGAFVLDLFFIPIFIGIFFAFVNSLLYLFGSEDLLSALEYWLIAGTFGYFVTFQWLYAGTIGQIIYGLRIIDLKTKTEIGFKKALLENLPYLIYILIISQGLGWFIGKGWAYFLLILTISGASFAMAGKKKLAIHNRLTNTAVIRLDKKLRAPILITSVIFIFASTYLISSILLEDYYWLPDRSAESLQELDDFLENGPDDFQDMLSDVDTDDANYTIEYLKKSIPLDSEELYEETIDAVVAINTDFGSGSGFIIDPDGIIVTAYHVIADAEQVGIATADNQKFYVEKVIDHSEEKDVAILKIDASNLPYVPIIDPEKNIKPGSDALVIGNPAGIRNSISQGIVGGMHDFNDVDHVLFDTPLAGGNSGGPVFNSRGEVIAIASFSIMGGGGDLNFGVFIHEIFALDFGNLMSIK